MREAYVILSKGGFDPNSDLYRQVVAVCPDEPTAVRYVELSEIDCMAIPAPMMESSEPVMRTELAESVLSDLEGGDAAC